MSSVARDVPLLPGTEPWSAPFWRLQAAAWAFLGLVYYLVLLPQSPAPPLALLAFKAVWAATGVGVSSGLAVVYRAARLPDRPPAAALAVALPLSAGLAAAWVLGLGAAADRVAGVPNLLFTPSSLPFVVLNHYLILLAWSAAGLGLAYRQRSEAAARRAVAAQGLARAAQLEMLRYQLNPHFLFNALNTVRALVLEDPARAREVVGRLSDLLRYALAEPRADRVPVRDEVTIVRGYLEIEKVRFEERLDAEVTLDPLAAMFEMPVFLLHTLVENAVKHGTPRDGRVVVRVAVTREGEDLRLVVENSGSLAGGSGEGPGVGLANVRRRLDGAYPGRHRLSLSADGGMVRAVVVLARAGDDRHA